MSSGYAHPEVTCEAVWLVSRPGLVTLLVLHGCLPAAVQPRVSGASCFSMATVCVLCVMSDVSTVLCVSFGVGSLALAFYDLGLNPETLRSWGLTRRQSKGRSSDTGWWGLKERLGT